MLEQNKMDYLSNYKTNQIITASREKIVLMMYDGAIRFIKQAKLMMEQKNHSKQGIYIGKALAIIMELKNALNKKDGGEIAINLERLYNYSIKELINANLHNTPTPLDVILRILTNLREGWAGIVEQSNLPEKEESYTPKTICV